VTRIVQPHPWRWSFVLAALATAAGCIVDPVAIEGKGCPCAAGYRCVNQVCVLEHDAGPEDAPLRDDGVTDAPVDTVADVAADAPADAPGPMDGPTDAPVTDAPPDAPALDDAPPDTGPDGPPPATCNWAAGPNVGTPERVPELSTVDREYGMALLSDGLTAYVSMGLPNAGADITDFAVATRPSLGGTFGPMTVVPELSTAYEESHATFTSDGLVVFFQSDRPGGTGGSDLWTASRASPADPFSSVQPVTDLNTADNEWDPYVSPDGLLLYWARDGASPLGDNTTHVFVARRASRGAPFGAPALVPGIVVYGVPDSGAWLTDDQRTIVFHSGRAGQGSRDMWYATRASAADAFGVALPVPVVNTADDDWKPFLRGDGCELFFASDRPGGGLDDIYRAVITP
jgi:hypothetical protein